MSVTTNLRAKHNWFQKRFGQNVWQNREETLQWNMWNYMELQDKIGIIGTSLDFANIRSVPSDTVHEEQSQCVYFYTCATRLAGRWNVISVCLSVCLSVPIRFRWNLAGRLGLRSGPPLSIFKSFKGQSQIQHEVDARGIYLIRMWVIMDEINKGD